MTDTTKKTRWIRLSLAAVAWSAAAGVAAFANPNVVIFPDHGQSGTSVLVWACGFPSHPWANGATPDHFEITVDNTTVVATVPVSQCNNVSLGFGQHASPPPVTISGAPGVHHVFVTLMFSNGVGYGLANAPFTVDGNPKAIIYLHPSQLFATPTPTPLVSITTPPPGAFTLQITSVNPPNPGSGQLITANYSLTDNWKTFGPGAQTIIVARLDDVTLPNCQLVDMMTLGQVLQGSLGFTAASGTHTLTLIYGGPSSCASPGPGTIRRFLVGPWLLASASQQINVGAMPPPTPTPKPSRCPVYPCN